MSFSLGSARGSIVIDYVGDGVQRAIADMNRLGSTSSTFADGLTTAGKASLAAGAAIGIPILGAVNAAADFEFGLDAVNAALGGLDATKLADVSEQAKTLGADTKFSANEILGVQEQLAKSGLSAEQLLGGATEAATNLAAATGEDLVASGTAAAAALNLFGLEGDQVSAVADTFTAGLNNSSATLSDFQRGVNNLGPVMANLARYAEDPLAAFQDTAAAVAFFNANGLKAADAGVSLARGMTNLADPSSKATAQMEALGISAFDMNGNFLPLPDLFDQLNTAMADMSDQAREQALAQIFGAEAADVMNQAIKKGGDPLREYEELTRQQGIAAEQAAIRQDNLRGAIEELGGAVETAAVALGTPLLAPLKGMAEGVKGVVEAFIGLDPAVQTFLSSFGAISALTLTIGGGLALVIGQVLKLSQAFAAAGLSLGRFALAFGVLGAALAAGVLAYQTNFLGFADAIDGALANAQRALKTFTGRFQSLFNARTGKGVNALSAGIEAFGEALLAATGIDIRGFTDPLARAFEDLIGNARAATEEGMNPLAAALDGLGWMAVGLGAEDFGRTLLDLSRTVQTFGVTFRGVRAALEGAGRVPLAANLEALGAALQAVTGLPVAGFFRELADAVQAFADASAQAAAEGAGPLEQAFRGLQASIESLTGFDLSGIADALGNIGGTIRDVSAALSEGDIAGAVDIAGAAFQRLRDFIGDAATGALQALQGLSGDLIAALNALGAQITSIDLGQLAVNIAGWVQGRWDDLKAWIEAQTGVAIDAIDVPALAVNIAGWFLGKVADLNAFLANALGLGTGGGATGAQQGRAAALGSSAVSSGIDLGVVTLNISEWAVGTLADLGSFKDSVLTWLHEQLTVDTAFFTEAGELGSQLGESLATALIEGIRTAIGGAFGGAEAAGADAIPRQAGGGSPLGGVSFGDAFANFDQEFTASVQAALETEFQQAQDALGVWIQERKTNLWNAIFDVLFLPLETEIGTGAAADTSAKAAESIGNPLTWFLDRLGEGADNVSEDAWGDAVPDGGLVTGAAAAGLAEEGIPDRTATTLGEQFGRRFGEVFSSPEFTQGIESSLAELPDVAFAGVGEAFLEKLNTGITSALTATTGKEEQIAADGVFVGRGMAEQLVTTLASGLQEAVSTIDPAIFVGVGQALASKISESLGQALNAAGTEGAELAGSGDVATSGGGIGTALVTNLASSLQTAISAVGPEVFAGAGGALMAKISEAITNALSGATPAQTGRVGADAAGGMGASLVTGLATSISASIAAAPIEAFAAVGAALQAKVSEAIALAMSVGTETAQGAPGGSGGAAAGGSIGAAIASSIATAIAGADFAAVGAALSTALGTAVSTAMQQITTTISTSANQWITPVQNAFSSMANAATANLGALAATVGTHFNAIYVAIQAASTAMIAQVQNAFMSMANTATANMTALQASVSSGFAAITATVTSAGAQMAAAVTSAGTQMSAAMTSAMAAVTAAVTSGMASAVAAVQSGVASIQAALASAAAGAEAAGAAVGAGFAAGISSQLGAVQSAAAELANAASSALASAAQVASPSKITTALGEQFGDGWVEGIRSRISDAIAAGQALLEAGMARLDEMLAAAQARIDEFLGTSEAAATATGEALAEGVDQAAGTAPEDALATGAATGAQVAQGIDESSGEATGAATDLGTATGEALGAGLDACTPATQAIEDATGCATDAVDATMAPALESAAGDAIQSTGETMQTEADAAGDAAGATFGDSMAQSMIGQMKLGGDGIAAEAMQSALGAAQTAEPAMREAGGKMGTALNEGFGASGALTPEALGIPESGRALAERLISEVNARLGQQEAVRNALLGDMQAVAADTNQRARELGRDQHIRIEVPVNLEREPIARVAAETVVGGLRQGLNVNTVTRRRR